MYSLNSTCDSEGSMMAVKMNLLCSSQKDGAERVTTVSIHVPGSPNKSVMIPAENRDHTLKKPKPTMESTKR